MDAGLATCLERDFSPPPHSFEQDDHSPYAPHSQSTTQASALQPLVSVAFPSQAFPPFDAGVETDLWQDFSPPPHVFEQDDHSPYGPHLQSTGSKIEYMHKRLFTSSVNWYLQNQIICKTMIFLFLPLNVVGFVVSSNIVVGSLDVDVENFDGLVSANSNN